MSESNALSRIIKSYLCGEWHSIPGSGKIKGCFSFIEDVVDGHLLAMKFGVAGEKYILGGENSDFDTFFSLVRKYTGKYHLLIKIPLPLLMLFGWQQELMAKWIGVYPLVTTKWIKKYNYDACFSSEKAISQLGYKITPLEEGIIKTIEWLQNDYAEFYP